MLEAEKPSSTTHHSEGYRMTWKAELDLAISAAKAAGTLLLEASRRPATILSEENNDIKLQVDRDAEALILGQLAPSGHHRIRAV